MKITKVKLKEQVDGILPFEQGSLGDIVILAGENGSGKTRLLNLISGYVERLENDDKIELFYMDSSENGVEEPYTQAAMLRIANYSHYDAVLQSAKKFSPYVIGKAKNLLLECKYEETALNALLVIQDMAYGYSEEFRDGAKFEEFKEFVLNHFAIEVEKTEKGINLFGRDADLAKLSPGQQYLLRIAVACFFNENKETLLFIMDEPELHLHPNAVIQMIEQMRGHFSETQFWISTHSIELISYITSTVDSSTVLCLDHGEVSLLRSDSSKIINGLLGHDDNIIYFQQFYNLPDQYACVRFALECFQDADTKEGKKGDLQQKLITGQLYPGAVVIDYGAGKGRLLEQLSMDAPELVSQIQYYAFNLPDCQDVDICKGILEKNKVDASHYLDNIDELRMKLGEMATHVFLVNVLHEIPPKEWSAVFNNIFQLLGGNGHLYILERAKLTVGEAPYDCGFLMVTDNAVRELFQEYEVERLPNKEYIVRYTIEKKNLANVSNVEVQKAVAAIKQDAIDKIRDLKRGGTIAVLKDRYYKGIELAFWLNQYANATLILENILESAEDDGNDKH